MPDISKLNLPDKFKQWRPYQEDALEKLIRSEKRFVLFSAPTGSGKSLVYMAYINWLFREKGQKSAILVSTRNLQDQLASDFPDSPSSSSRVIKGMANYPCLINESFQCNQGPCLAGYKCPDKKECHYYRNIFEAKFCQKFIANYSFWMNILLLDDPFELTKHVNMLVMDEAHLAPTLLSDFIDFEFNATELKRLFKIDTDRCRTIAEWKTWAARVRSTIMKVQNEIRTRFERGGVSFTNNLAEKIEFLYTFIRVMDNIQEMSGDWLFEQKDQKDGSKIFRFNCIKPSAYYAEHYLFSGIKKIVLTSATICRKTLNMLGVKNEEIETVKCPSLFPVENRRIFHVNTIRMNKKTNRTALMEIWLKRIDSIISKRRDRKGIIHAVSYKRAEFILTYSRHKDIMFCNRRQNIKKAVEHFKNTHAPAVFVSPSLSCGYDFPFEDCEYQIISKIPFPNISDPALQARCLDDPQLIDYITMQTLVQSCGRGVRAPDDRCETFIIDDTVKWWFKRNKHLAPDWFTEAYRSMAVLPEPLPKLTKENNQPVMLPDCL